MHLVQQRNRQTASPTTNDCDDGAHKQLVKPFGLEADRHLLRCLFSSIDFSDANSQTAKHSQQAKLLNQELNAVLNKSSLITNICFAIDNCFPHQKVSIRTASERASEYVCVSRDGRRTHSSGAQNVVFPFVIVLMDMRCVCV